MKVSHSIIAKVIEIEIDLLIFLFS